MSSTSEFICQVVQVVGVEPHPNADKLDLLTISLDGKTLYPYKIINAKEGLKSGELAVYVGPDSIVPLHREEFSFLKGRLDAKDKTHYRVRSAKIRGLYSPGLLVVPSASTVYPLKLGKDVSRELEVNGYNTDAHLPGISLGNKSVSKVQRKNIYPVYEVVNLKKVPHLFKEGDPVYVTEKIHGTNFRFGFGGGRRFYYGTHRTSLSDTRGFLSRALDFLRGRRWVNSNPGFNNPWAQAVQDHNLEETCSDAREYIFYGELFGTVKNGSPVQKGFTYGYNKGLALRIFDVYHPRTKEWLPLNTRNNLCYSLGLVSVPVLHTFAIPFDLNTVKAFAEQSSVFGGVREGVVVESAFDATRKGKWVSEQYHLCK